MRRRAVLVAAVALLALAGGAVTSHQARLRPGWTGTGDLLTLLVIGSDAGPPPRAADPLGGNADALHLIAVDPAARTGTVIDIPRDTLVNGRKLNSYLASDGPEGMKAQVEGLAGVTVDFWVLTTFEGLPQVVTALGGVEVTVDVPMRDAFSGSDFDPGVQRLDGPQALAFSRDRHSMPDGDIGRTRHQGELILAAHRDVVTRGLVDVARLTAAFLRSTVSDIPPGDVLGLAMLATQVQPGDVAHVPLGGAIRTVRGQSVVLLAPGDAFQRLQDGRTGPGR